MKILYFAAIFALLYTVHCKPSKTDDEDIYGPLADENVQNDNEDYTNYDDDETTKDEDSLDTDSDEPIYIITDGQEFTRTVNQSILLPCNVSGKNAVQLWKKNTQILFQDGSKMAASDDMKAYPNGSLEISNIKQEDAGDYLCVVLVSGRKNPEIIHHLNVRVPPHNVVVAAKDGLAILKTGDSLVLTCTADGYPKPKITWHKQEKLSTEGETLVVSNLKHHHAGTYRCLADNGVGLPAFSNIDIKVETKPVMTIDQFTVTSENNDDTELKCIVHAEPRAQVNWRKDQRNVANSTHTQLKNDKNSHILIIKGLQESDFGTYECLAVNSLGETRRHIKLVRTPVTLRFIKPEKGTKEVVLTWEVQSKSAISGLELEYTKENDTKWEIVKPEVPNAMGEIYTVKYTLQGLEPGKYQTRMRSQNNYGWSDYSEIMTFEGVFAKHGHHHNKHNKSGRKDNAKDKHITQEVTTQSKPVEPEVPAEHQESEKHSDLVKDAPPPVGASETSDCAAITSPVSLISIALIVLLQIRQ